MPDMKHTPGPWDVSGYGVWGVSPWNARFRIATITAPSPMNGVDGQANTHLIAAAPCLLEALTELVRINTEHNAAIEGVIGRPAGWSDDYLDKARAAIAKATNQN